MAKIKFNSLVEALRGTLGDIVIVPLGDGFYIRAKGDTPDPSSPAQLAHLTRFGEASVWAKKVLQDPAIKAAYQKTCQGHTTPHNAAVGDFMNPPFIERIELESYTGRPGESIGVIARDQTGVTHLTVLIEKAGGERIEEGAAEKNLVTGTWLYLTRAQVASGTTLRVKATAADLPGNRVTSEAFHFVP